MMAIDGQKPVKKKKVEKVRNTVWGERENVWESRRKAVGKEAN